MDPGGHHLASGPGQNFYFRSCRLAGRFRVHRLATLARSISLDAVQISSIAHLKLGVRFELLDHDSKKRSQIFAAGTHIKPSRNANILGDCCVIHW